MAVLAIVVYVGTLSTFGDAQGSIDEATLRANPALGRGWLTFCGMFLGGSVAMCGAAIRAKNAWLDLLR